MIKYIITGAIGFYLGAETLFKLTGFSETLDKKKDFRQLEYVARWFGIKTGVDWSDERKEDYLRSVLVRLGMDHKVHKICERIQAEVRAEQDKLA